MRSVATKAERAAAKNRLEDAAGNLMRAGTEDGIASIIRDDIAFIEARPDMASTGQYKVVLSRLHSRLGEVEGRAAAYRESAATSFSIAEALEDRTSSELLLLRYRDGLGWDEVAERLGYCGDYVRGNLHHKALAAYAEALKMG